MSISGIVSVKAQNGGKVFPPSEKVTVQKVSVYNRLGIQIVGDMYIPAGIDLQQKYPAIVVAHPYGGVKEQTAGLYAPVSYTHLRQIHALPRVQDIVFIGAGSAAAMHVQRKAV